MKVAARLLLILALVAPAFASAQAPQTQTPAPTCQLLASATNVKANTRVRLEWTSTNATSGYLAEVGTIAAKGYAFVVPGRNTTYAASFTGPGGSVVCRVAIAVSSGSSGGGVGGGVPVDTNDPVDTNVPVDLSGRANLGGQVALPTVPSVAPALTPPSGGTGFVGGIVPAECRGSRTVANCDLCSLAQLGQNLANFLLGLTIPAAALLFAWAGILYFSSRGNPAQITQAHKVFKRVVIGLVIAVSAWTLVNVAMNMLIKQGDLKNWNWKELKCQETRQARLYNMSIDEYLGSSLSKLTSYSGQSSYSCSNGMTLQGDGYCYDSSGARQGPPTIEAWGGSGTTACPAGAVPEGGRCIDYTGGRAIDIGPATSGDSSSNSSGSSDTRSGPGGSCPSGYKYASNSRESWCDSLTDNTWVETDGSGEGSGNTYGVAGGRCDVNNPACGTAALTAEGLNDRQANAMACIAVTESGGNPYTSDSETAACGTFQITNETSRSNWQNPKHHGPGCSVSSSCNDATCNRQTAVIMFNQQSYQPWTGADTRTGVPWNPNARRCVEQYDPSAVRW